MPNRGGFHNQGLRTSFSLLMDKVPKVTTPVELTKKQELNNHIVSMRKCVQQARVHTINHLVKEVKLLKKRKGDENVVQKCQRKSQRLLDEVFVLKHLNKDEVSVFALKAKLTLVQVLQDSETSVKTRALARISHHPVVQDQVQKYRDSNPHWALQIPVLLEKSKEKQKKTEKKLEKKEKLKLERVNPPEGTDGPKADSSESESDEQVSVPLKNPVSINTKKTKAKQQPVTLDKVEGTIKVKVLKDLTDLETEPEATKRKLRSLTVTTTTEAGDEGRPQKRPRSSFFVGGVDEEITPVKEVKVQPPRVPKGQYSEPKPIFRKGKLISKPPNRAERRAGFKGTNNSRPQKQFDKPGKSFGAAANRFPTAASNTQRVPSIPVAAGAEKLHPSWEAKKRQAQVLTTSFQGRKTVFQNDD